MQHMSFLRSKLNYNMIFWIQYFQKTCHVEKISIQILSRCKNFISKYDALDFFQIKI